MYGVIYNGNFSEEGYKYFSSWIIRKAAAFKFWKKKDINKLLSYYLGIDPAGQGKAKAAFVSAELRMDRINVPHFETIDKSTMPELARKTEELHKIFNYRKIFIDPGGLGEGVVDILKENKKIRRRIRPLNNAEAGKYGKILKQDLYSNTLKLFEEEKIEIIDDEELIKALLDVEIDVDGKIKGTDISEAFVRACWCMKEKSYKVKIITF